MKLSKFASCPNIIWGAKIVGFFEIWSCKIGQIQVLANFKEWIFEFRPIFIGHGLSLTIYQNWNSCPSKFSKLVNFGLWSWNSVDCWLWFGYIYKLRNLIILFDFLSNRNHLDIIQFFDDWITGRTKILRENAYQLSKTQLEEKIQDRAMHVRDQ